MLDWLGDANPEVTALCVTRSGARVPADTLRRLRDRWLPRLTDLTTDPDPQARAAVGRALGMLTLDGMPLDNRKGVAVWRTGRMGILLPDIDWVDVAEGPFKYGEEAEDVHLHAFRLARYPVTNVQFQCFIDDGGYDDEAWWRGLERNDPAPSRWEYANHPRETVSWYQATAFCRWLDARMREHGQLADGWHVRLPTEQEWEKAARGTDGRDFPWGDFASGRANMDEMSGNAGPHSLAQTSAVGIYPEGDSPCAALDMAGNVWEWCASKYDPKDASDAAPRVLRGGSWNVDRAYCRCACRDGFHPGFPYRDFGFRVCLAPPIK